MLDEAICESFEKYSLLKHFKENTITSVEKLHKRKVNVMAIQMPPSCCFYCMKKIIYSLLTVQPIVISTQLWLELKLELFNIVNFLLVL